MAVWSGGLDVRINLVVLLLSMIFQTLAKRGSHIFTHR
jgi:hypothetical protein